MVAAVRTDHGTQKGGDMEQLAIGGQVFLIGRAREVFAELERIAAFSEYGIGWCHPIRLLDISAN